MTTKEQYLELGEKLTRLKERRAVLEAREADRAKESERISAELRLVGVDPTNPDAEIERLTREIDAEFARAQSEIDTFERDLTAAEEGRLPASQVETRPDPPAASKPLNTLIEDVPTPKKQVVAQNEDLLADLEIS